MFRCDVFCFEFPGKGFLACFNYSRLVSARKEPFCLGPAHKGRVDCPSGLLIGLPLAKQLARPISVVRVRASPPSLVTLPARRQAVYNRSLVLDGCAEELGSSPFFRVVELESWVEEVGQILAESPPAQAA